MSNAGPTHDTAEVELPKRQCGRCRAWFEGDPDADPVGQADWWVCARCRAILLSKPGPAGGRTVQAIPKPPPKPPKPPSKTALAAAARAAAKVEAAAKAEAVVLASAVEAAAEAAVAIAVAVITPNEESPS